MKFLFALLLAVGFLLSSCTPAASGSSATGQVSTAVAGTIMPVTLPPAGSTAPPAPTLAASTPISTLTGGGLSPPELKYRLLQQYPDFFFCDPDLYPIAVEDETQLALQHFPEIQENAGEFQAILSHLGLSGSTSFGDADKLLIYQEHKRLNALILEPEGDRYRFQFQISDNAQNGFLLTGTIDGRGNIDLESKDAGIATCPICLALDTRIDTPRGPVAVQFLHPGDTVWTQDVSGRRIAARLLQTGRIQVRSSHRMVHLVLADGGELWASPGHPAADGRPLRTLKAGDMLAGVRVRSANWVPYSGGATFDILPSGGTGLYWANGILLRSTLQH